jgi:hypothetical protein
MIADINESGRISVKAETDQESEMLKSWLQENVNLSQSFMDCCNNKKCAFRFDMKPQMIEQECAVCGKKFQGTVKIEICPSCYV